MHRAVFAILQAKRKLSPQSFYETETERKESERERTVIKFGKGFSIMLLLGNGMSPVHVHVADDEIVNHHNA